MPGLLFGQLEIAVPVIVIPTAGHRSLIHLALDNEVNGLAGAGVLSVGFHVDLSALRIECAFLYRNRRPDVLTARNIPGQGLSIPFQRQGDWVAISRARPPIARPCAA